MVLSMIAAAVGGAVLFIFAGPAAVASMGFTAAGIAEGSIAAFMMSLSAIASGGGVLAGSLVSIFQSIGAAGLSFAGYVVLGVVGAAVGTACGILALIFG